MKEPALYIIRAENFMMDGGATFGVVPKTLWKKSWEPDAENRVAYSCRCLLVVDGDQRILIDTGMGDKQEQKFREHQHLFGTDTLEGSLAAHGFAPGEVTDVIFTHLHYDHCGGAVKYHADRTRTLLTFPHARHWCSRRQWDWAMHPNAREGASYFPENLLPLKESGTLNFIEEQTTFSAHVDLLQVHGHTDGQLIPMIRFAGRTVVFMADFIPSAGHIPLAWVASYDTRPLLAMQEKEIFLKEAVEKNYILFFEHPFHHEAATVKMTEKGVRADRIGTLDELLKG